MQIRIIDSDIEWVHDVAPIGTVTVEYTTGFWRWKQTIKEKLDRVFAGKWRNEHGSAFSWTPELEQALWRDKYRKRDADQ